MQGLREALERLRHARAGSVEERVAVAEEHAALAHGPEPVTDQVNRAIFTMMGSIPNGAVLDWDRLVPPELMGSDGVHPITGLEGL